MVSWQSIKDLFEDAYYDPSEPPVLARIRDDRSDTRGGGRPVRPNCYVQVRLRRMQLEYGRIAWADFEPIAGAFVELSRDGQDRVTTPFLAGREALPGYQKTEEHLILTQNVPVIPYTPYSGGDLRVAIGLSAAKSNDYLSNLLGVMSKLSTVVGGTAYEAAVGVADTLADAASSLLGVKKDVQLRVGAVNSFSQHQPADGEPDQDDEATLLTGVYAIVNTNRRDIGPALAWRQNELWLGRPGASSGADPVTADHLVFEVDMIESLSDYQRFPYVQKLRQQAFKAAVEHGRDSDEYRAAILALRLRLIDSADLTVPDQVRIWKAVDSQAVALSDEAPVTIEGGGPPMLMGPGSDEIPIRIGDDVHGDAVDEDLLQFAPTRDEAIDLAAELDWGK